MTVVGLGLDVVGLAAFGEQIADRSSGFLAATFTPAELEDVRRSPTPDVQGLAGKFAAKEAFTKAWSSSRLGRSPALAHVVLTDIEVVHDSFGRPVLRLHGGVAEAFTGGGPAGTTPEILVSITHDEPVAVAVVVLGL